MIPAPERSVIKSTSQVWLNCDSLKQIKIWWWISSSLFQGVLIAWFQSIWSAKSIISLQAIIVILVKKYHLINYNTLSVKCAMVSMAHFRKHPFLVMGFQKWELFMLCSKNYNGLFLHLGTQGAPKHIWCLPTYLWKWASFNIHHSTVCTWIDIPSHVCTIFKVLIAN